MMLIAFICLASLSVLLGVLYSIFSYNKKSLNVAAKLAAIISCGILIIVCANMSSAIGGFPIFLICGILFALVSEALKFIDFENDKWYFALSNVFNCLLYICMIVAGLFIGGFNYFSIIFAVFVSLAMVLLSLARNEDKQSPLFWVTRTIGYLTVAMLLGQGFTLLTTSVSLVTGLLFMLGSAFLLGSKIIEIYQNDDSELVRILANAANILGLILISSSIYFI